jgi:hypothetical protein
MKTSDSWACGVSHLSSVLPLRVCVCVRVYLCGSFVPSFFVFCFAFEFVFTHMDPKNTDTLTSAAAE